MIWLYVYITGVLLSAAIIGAVAVPASGRHSGHPADDPIIAIFLAFLWPLILVGIPIVVALYGSWVIGRLFRKQVSS